MVEPPGPERGSCDAAPKVSCASQAGDHPLGGGEERDRAVEELLEDPGSLCR